MVRLLAELGLKLCPLYDLLSLVSDLGELTLAGYRKRAKKIEEDILTRDFEEGSSMQM